MNYSEAHEQLSAAKPLIERVKISRVGWQPSMEEFEALEAIEQLLQEFAFNPKLLMDSGWSRVDIVFLHSRLNYYYATHPKALVHQ